MKSGITDSPENLSSGRTPYPIYEDSGIDWLGKVPSGWKVKRLRFAAEINPSKSDLDGTSSQMNVSFIPMEMIGEDGSLRPHETRTKEDASEGYTYFRNGDVLVAKITPCFENGKGALAADLCNGIGFGTTELHVIRPHKDVSPAFLNYMTRTSYFRILGTSWMYGSAGQQRVPERFVKDFPCLIPPLNQQHAIVNYIQRETCKIDALIAKKQRLIELLNDKRAAIISHAVTKGIDPSVPMKDSGIQCLEEIPSTWRLIQFRRLIRSMCDGPFGSDLKSSHYSDRGIRVIRLQNVGWGVFNDGDKAFVSESYFSSLKGHDATMGDLIVAGLGDENHPVGRACLVPPFVKKAMVKADCFRLRLDESGILPEFAVHYLSSHTARFSITWNVHGATRRRINLSGLASITIIVPSLSEQHAIVEFIDDRCKDIKRLIDKVTEGIEFLKEYRTALISAAVTGKIDVRKEGYDG